MPQQNNSDPYAAFGGKAVSDPYAAFGGKVESSRPDLSKQNALIDKQLAENPQHPYYGFTPSNVAKNAYEGAKSFLQGSYSLGKDLIQNPNWFEGPTSTMQKFVYGPSEEQTIKAGQSLNKGDTLPAVGHAVASAIPFIGPWAASLGEQAGKGDIGGAAGQVAGTAGAAEAVPRVAGIAVEKLPKIPSKIADVVRTTPKEALASGWTEFLKSKPTGIKADLRGYFNELGNSGHLQQIAEAQPKGYRDAYDATKAHMREFYQGTIEAAMKNQSDATISADPIAKKIGLLVTPTMEKFFPDQVKALNAEAARFKGKSMTIEEANELLKTFNAMSDRMQSMAPESRVAAERVNASKAALDKATDELRNQIYSTLEARGEMGIRAAQRQYGALSEFRDILRKNIPRAERAEATKPRYREIPRRAISRHELLAGGIVAGGAIRPEVLPALGVLPAMEAVDVYTARANTPDAALARAFRRLRKSPSLPPMPSMEGLK